MGLVVVDGWLKLILVFSLAQAHQPCVQIEDGFCILFYCIIAMLNQAKAQTQWC